MMIVRNLNDFFFKGPREENGLLVRDILSGYGTGFIRALFQQQDCLEWWTRTIKLCAWNLNNELKTCSKELRSCGIFSLCGCFMMSDPLSHYIVIIKILIGESSKNPRMNDILLTDHEFIVYSVVSYIFVYICSTIFSSAAVSITIFSFVNNY